MVVPLPVSAQDQRAILELIVNDVPKGEALVILRGEEALIGVATLTTAGLQNFAGRREPLTGEEFVSLASLAPAVTFKVDERDLRLYLTAAPNLLGGTVSDLQPGAPEDLVYRGDTSGFVNYALNWRGTDSYDVFAESALNLRGRLLYGTFTAAGRAATRGLTNLTIDERGRMQRWRFGDSFATGGVLGGDVLIAGVNVFREFSLAPYFVRNPTLSLSTALTTPSVVEVYVNNRLVREETVQPGRLDLRNLPMATGRNEARIVIRDPFGATQELATAYYLTTAALATGVHDYQYSFGFRRSSLGVRSWDYSAPVLLARHRFGLTDGVTAGGRLEIAARLVSGGPTVNLRLPVGEVEAAAAMSRASAHWGSSAIASYTYARRVVSVGGTLAGTSAHYATLSLAPGDNRPKIEAGAFASAQIGRRTSVTWQHSHAVFHRSVSQARSALLASARLSAIADLIVSTTRVRDEFGSGTELFAGVTVLFGHATVGSFSLERARDGNRAMLQAQKPLPLGEGYGYRFRSEIGTRSFLNGTVEYQGPYGRYEFRREALEGEQHTSASMSGALVGIGGRVYPSRAVQNSFALVRVPGVKGVTTFSSNQEIGRTDARGNVLVPDLIPYYGNLLNIADADIPLDYAIREVRITLAPPYRAGALVVFPVQRVQSTSGTIVVVSNAQERAPAYGELTVTVNGSPVVSPVGGQGEFYFENLLPGRYPALVEDKDGACSFMLTMPEADTPIVSLGTIRCVEAKL